MRNIIITNGNDTVTLSNDLLFTLKPQLISKSAVLLSGRTVVDVIGIKDVLTIPIGWINSEELIKLKNMIESFQALTVTYPSVDGMKVEQFLVDFPEYRTVKYDDDGVLWLGVTLNMTSKGVR